MYRLPNSVTNLVDVISSLPGVGPKSAMKIALYLIYGNKSLAEKLRTTLLEAAESLATCKLCGNIINANDADQICDICADSHRGKSVMIVETLLDLVNVESAGVYKGKYHIINGLVSPVKATSLESLNVLSLLPRIENEGFEEIISALPSNIEGDTTALLIKELIIAKFPQINMFKLGRGLPSGANVEFLDSETVKNSIINKSSF